MHPVMSQMYSWLEDYYRCCFVLFVRSCSLCIIWEDAGGDGDSSGGLS